MRGSACGHKRFQAVVIPGRRPNGMKQSRFSQVGNPLGGFSCTCRRTRPGPHLTLADLLEETIRRCPAEGATSRPTGADARMAHAPLLGATPKSKTRVSMVSRIRRHFGLIGPSARSGGQERIIPRNRRQTAGVSRMLQRGFALLGTGKLTPTWIRAGPSSPRAEQRFARMRAGGSGSFLASRYLGTKALIWPRSPVRPERE